ncbi:MAG: hypothetical protein DRP58_07835 [Spirochaetes bacterium]|nr:MAG: hypothetical protein DRP58_07835 [Spirochaetota bacterium]
MNKLRKNNRHSIRMKGYDYSKAGVYYITICTQNRKCLFGDIINGEMQLNDTGSVVVDEWMKIPGTQQGIELEEWVVMPNHFHGIIIFTESVGAIHESPLPMTQKQRRNMGLPKLIGRFKMLSSKKINEIRQTPGVKLWQRNYWEHIIRNNDELINIREYIRNNPRKWSSDQNKGN